MSIKKRIFALALPLIVMMVMAVLFSMPALAADTEHSHPICGTACTHEGAHAAVAYTQLTAELAEAGLSDGSYYLAEDITTNATITISGEVNLCLNGYVLDISRSSSTTSVLQINDGATLNLCDCNSGSQSHNFGVDSSTGQWLYTTSASGTETVTGGVIIGRAGTGVCVSTNNATFNMYGGNIVGCNNRGVKVVDGTFTMNGGSISGNTTSNVPNNFKYGGGVYVSGGSFTMNDGTISNNAAYGGGGVIMTLHDSVASPCLFIMNGGTISNNAATQSSGGGVYIDYGTFTMNDGTINDNTATQGGGGGVSVIDYGTFTMNDGTINDNTAYYGGGVSVGDYGTFTMNDGTISGNTAYYGYGGGVSVTYQDSDISDPCFTMNGGTISGNTAPDGGGVSVIDAIATMNGGTISGNTATGNGGGVYVNFEYPATLSYTIFTMNGGTISSNRATNGGGVYIYNVYLYSSDHGTTFTMNGGTIGGNTATVNGGGVYYYDGTFNISGSPEIRGNTKSDGTVDNVYIDNSSLCLTVVGALEGESLVGVTMGTTMGTGTFATPSGDPLTDLTDYKGFFFSDEKISIRTGKASVAGETYINLALRYYNIAVKTVVYGKIETSTTYAVDGDIISVNVELDTGYELASLIVTDQDNNRVEYTPDAAVEGKYTFVMPAADVTVTALLFGPHSHPICGTDCNGVHGAETDTNDTHAPVRWTPLSSVLTNGGDLAAGNYYLDKAMTLRNAIKISGKVNLCLNGYALQYTGSDSTASVLQISDGATLNLCDCNSENKRHSFAVNSKTGLWTLVGVGAEMEAVTGGVIIGGAGTGVNVSVSTAAFNMYGGNIVGCAHRGVQVVDGTFTMNDGTIRGNTASTATGERGGGVQVVDGTFTMNGGTISGNIASSSGGVYINNGTFTMNDGTISGNTTATTTAGGGMVVDNGSTFTMNGGTIESHTAFYGGGVYVASTSTFIMNGGTIRENSATNYGYGGGVYVASNGTFIMNSGTISGNISNCSSTNYGSSGGGGVHVSGIFTMNGGTISENTSTTGYGGGVFVASSATFTMTGGTIGENSATTHGGGVFVASSATFTMNGGTIESHTSVPTGGGVSVASSATFTMNDGTIKNNRATSYGGGVFVASSATFTMNDGTITSNFASNNGGGVKVGSSATFTMNGGSIKGNRTVYNGGGVSSEGTFTMTGGTISENTASYGGSGVYSYQNSTFNISGSPEIRGNIGSNAYLTANTGIITVVGALEGESLVGVTLSTTVGTFAKPSGDPLTDLTDYKGFFFSDEKVGIRTVEEQVAEETYINLELFYGYNVTVNTAEHGKVEASDTYAAAGDIISINVEPDTGYELASLIVTDKDNNQVAYTPDAAVEGKYTFTMPESEVWITATFKLKQYTVTYDLNGGTGAEGVDYTAQTVYAGTKIIVKAGPSLTGYRFDGWTYETNTYTAGDEIMVYSDITLTAQWVKQYTVTYDLNGGAGAEGVDYTAQTVDTGTKITVKAGPSRTGYRFDGWTYGTNTYTAGDEIMVYSDITLTAQWVKQYTVTLDGNGGTPTYEIKVDSGESANDAFNSQMGTAGKDAGEELVPTREGYIFRGWYVDKNTWRNKYDFTAEVTADVTVYAMWEDVPPVVISGTASLTKVDAEDPATVLSGVVFELRWSDGVLVGTYTTDASGQIAVQGLMPGTYYWREIRAAEGYVLDKTERVFTVYADQTSTLVVKNERSKVPEVFSGDHYAYVIGYNDGTVRPEANITRAEVATIFFRLLDDETRTRYLTHSNSFADVEEGAWYNTAISTMAAMGVVNGYPDGKFHPGDNITRAEFAAIAARFDASGNTTGASFTDIYDHWARKEIDVAANNGWVLGYEDGTFRPNQLITRAEAMTMVNRVLQRIPESVDDLHPNMVTWPDNMDTSTWYYLMVQEATNSHYYARKDNGYEYWTGLWDGPDWAELER